MRTTLRGQVINRRYARFSAIKLVNAFCKLNCCQEFEFIFLAHNEKQHIRSNHSSPACHRPKPKNRPRKRGEDKPTKNDSLFCCPLFVGARSCIASCLPVNYPSPKIDRASGVRTSRQKCRQVFLSAFLSVRSSFDDEILRRDESRPRSSIPSAVLARGKTKYRRKRSRQNLVLTPLARSIN